METYIETRVISLNSEYANNFINGTYNSNVEFYFKNVLKDDPNNIQATIQILNALIPVSFYQINYTNNIFIYSLNSITYSFFIQVGNYNSSSLITEIQNKFLLATGSAITISISRVTGIFSFSTSLNIIILYSELSVVLGFIKNTNYPFVYNNTSSKYELTAPFPLNLLGVKKIKIVSNALSTHSFDSYGSSNTNLISTLPSNSPAFGLIIFQNQSSSYSILRNKFINTIDIQLFDERNNYINFNNIHWCLTLTLNITKQRPIINNPVNTISDVINKQLDTDIQQLTQTLANTNLQESSDDLGNTDQTDTTNQDQNQPDSNYDLNEVQQDLDPSDTLDFLQYNGELK